MITRCFAQHESRGDEFEIPEARTLEDATAWARANWPDRGSYLIMERRYEMKSERATTVNTGS